jgi:RNA polymerase sigma-70 factor (ECF subfamily)
MSREEDDFSRIIDILRSGLVPAPQRAALLEALSRIPGVTATDNVKNLDGVAGVAIGRTEPLRSGERQEIIIDPSTGLVIGERTMSGTTLFGWGPDHQIEATATQTTVTNEVP